MAYESCSMKHFKGSDWNGWYERNELFTGENEVQGACCMCLCSSVDFSVYSAVSIQEQGSYCICNASSWCFCCSCQMDGDIINEILFISRDKLRKPSHAA